MNHRDPMLLLAGDQSRRLDLTGSVDLTFADGEDGKRPTFAIDAYSGDPVRVGMFFSPVIVDLGGLKAARQNLPVLLDHDTTRIVGQSDSVTIDSSGVNLTGKVTGDDADAQKVVNHAKNGFQWQASIGANIDRREFLEPGKKTTVNGREVTGPMVIAREATLAEVSFVAIGADKKTKADVAATNNPGGADVEFNEWVTAKGFDPDNLSESARAFLKAQWEEEKNPRPTPTPGNDPNLNDLMANRRKEQDRIDAITKIAERALDENPRQVDAIEAMARMAIESKWAPEHFELQLLRGTRPQAAISFRREEAKITSGTIEAALCMSGGLPDSQLAKTFDEKTLDAAHTQYPHGIGLGELLLTFANRNDRGNRHLSVSNVRSVLKAAFAEPDIRASGFSTLSLPGILGNTANKFLLMGWMAVDSTWSRISSRRNVSDFKTVTSYSLTGDFQYEKVGPAGEVKHGEVGEQSYTNKAETYARMFAITRTDIINDDLGALTMVPRRLGRGAALSLNNIFWTTFLNNSTFWTAGTGSRATGAGSALNLAGLEAAEVLFMNQTDPDSKPLGLMPAILLVPPTLKATALQLMNSQLIVTGANTTLPNTNVWTGRFSVESSPYMENSSYTGYSTTAWYLLANPQDLSAVEVAFLNGRETPTVESADADFNTLGIQMRGYHDFGVSLQEYRAGVANDGT